MRIVCIADSHGHHEEISVPDGDVLVHAGDLTAISTAMEVRDFFAWYSRQTHPHKLCIAGMSDSVSNVRNVIASSLGAEWRYWSKNFEWTCEKSTRRLLSQVNEIFLHA